MNRFVSLSVPALLTLVCTTAAWAINVPDKCEAGKDSTAGKYAACRLAAEAKAVKTGLAADFSKCDSSLAAKWEKLETAGGGSCPTNGDVAALQSFVTGRTSTIAAALSGAGLPSCGNGVVDQVGEHCDGADMDGYTCETLSLAGQLACTGTCDFNGAGCFSCPGQIVGGYCWLLSASNESCDTSCADVGMVYDDATRTYAGSDGNLAQCTAVLDALAPEYSSLFSFDSEFPCPTGWGCVLDDGGFEYRCVDPATTSSDQYANVHRACACKP